MHDASIARMNSPFLRVQKAQDTRLGFRIFVKCIPLLVIARLVRAMTNKVGT
jgi:hypothetical protein